MRSSRYRARQPEKCPRVPSPFSCDATPDWLRVGGQSSRQPVRRALRHYLPNRPAGRACVRRVLGVALHLNFEVLRGVASRRTARIGSLLYRLSTRGSEWVAESGFRATFPRTSRLTHQEIRPLASKALSCLSLTISCTCNVRDHLVNHPVPAIRHLSQVMPVD
jgi:hypothetical protein